MLRLSGSSVVKLVPVFCLIFILGCKEESATTSEELKELEGLYAGVPNPASVYCQEVGYKTELRSDSAGNQYEMCIFPDGSECRSWDFLKGKCGQKFSFCEKEGFKIENRFKEMNTWSMEYAVCIFPDKSQVKHSFLLLTLSPLSPSP